MRAGYADDPEGWMGGGVGELALERFQRSAQHVRLGNLELRGKPFQPASIGGIEVDLDGFREPTFALAPTLVFHDIMI